MSYFSSLVEFYVFTLLFIFFLISEVIIKIYADINRLRSFNKRKSSDVGSIFIAIIGLFGSLQLSFFLSNDSMSSSVIRLHLPNFIFFFGVFFMLGGVVLRCVSVLTLKRAFTVVVQTTVNQKLIKHGMYKFLRNPSYTGLLLFTIGVALSLRNLTAVILSLILFTVCFGIRIIVEEKALRTRFGQEFDEYCINTWRLIPFIW
ncbi:methyltransferase family protein [Gottfriedia sp. NPDC056225]|uniref:methyltransferase family protein n=1 Tax=Gottfriedia sp. NPDC056225 TaxID=3345751 RepID=UPI001558D996|nr:isoprenylcysteine carboxylmethyltransferase family protein [Arthrobacter citreus]